jgi:N-dimethylarginine dimethylaminohydrolase
MCDVEARGPVSAAGQHELAVGDFLVHVNEIYLGQGHGSNALGAKFAQAILGDEYEVIPLKLSDAALHLDCTIALIRPGLGLICPEWLDDELPEAIRDWTWIETTEQEALWLAANGLPLHLSQTIYDIALSPRLWPSFRLWLC